MILLRSGVLALLNPNHKSRSTYCTVMELLKTIKDDLVVVVMNVYLHTGFIYVALSD